MAETPQEHRCLTPGDIDFLAELTMRIQDLEKKVAQLTSRLDKLDRLSTSALPQGRVRRW